jgi:hypothetical protein
MEDPERRELLIKKIEGYTSDWVHGRGIDEVHRARAEALVEMGRDLDLLTKEEHERLWSEIAKRKFNEDPHPHAGS